MRETLLKKKRELREKRRKRVKGKVEGTKERPRVSVFKSNRYFYAQAIDDTNSHTLASINGAKLKLKANRADAKTLGEKFADVLKEKGIENIVFDRNGYLYHGVVAVFADALRENGIKF